MVEERDEVSVCFKNSTSAGLLQLQNLMFEMNGYHVKFTFFL